MEFTSLEQQKWVCLVGSTPPRSTSEFAPKITPRHQPQITPHSPVHHRKKNHLPSHLRQPQSSNQIHACSSSSIPEQVGLPIGPYLCVFPLERSSFFCVHLAKLSLEARAMAIRGEEEDTGIFYVLATLG